LVEGDASAAYLGQDVVGGCGPATGSELVTLVLPEAAMAVSVHPFASMVVCGDSGGGMHLAHVVGVALGPLVVTAAGDGHELTVRCPACGEAFAVDHDRLGTDTACPRLACGTRLRINPFVLQPLPRRRIVPGLESPRRADPVLEPPRRRRERRWFRRR
jgi:hypothetical protein